MTFHAMTEHYEEITVCGKPALFTSIRILCQIFIPEIVADNVLCILSNRRLQMDYIIKSTRSQQGWWHIPCIVSSSNHKKICILCIINTGLQTSPFRRIGKIRFYIEVQIF